jgi:antitoxin PrlF
MMIAMTEELEVTIMSEKGQVVIPKSIREELEIKPKTKLLVYGKGDTIIMKKLQLPDLKKEWEDIFKLMDKKELKLSNAEIQKEIKETRK